MHVLLSFFILGPARPKSWKNFNPAVETALEGEYSRDVTGLIPNLMDRYKLKVLVYSGQFDLICCALGTDRWVDSMQWSGQADYVKAARVPWQVGGSLAGFVQHTGLLRRVIVSNAGHYVPYDQPRNSVEMIQDWLLAM